MAASTSVPHLNHRSPVIFRDILNTIDGIVLALGVVDLNDRVRSVAPTAYDAASELVAGADLDHRALGYEIILDNLLAHPDTAIEMVRRLRALITEA